MRKISLRLVSAAFAMALVLGASLPAKADTFCILFVCFDIPTLSPAPKAAPAPIIGGGIAAVVAAGAVAWGWSRRRNRR